MTTITLNGVARPFDRGMSVADLVRDLVGPADHQPVDIREAIGSGEGGARAPS